MWLVGFERELDGKFIYFFFFWGREAIKWKGVDLQELKFLLAGGYEGSSVSWLF